MKLFSLLLCGMVNSVLFSMMETEDYMMAAAGVISAWLLYSNKKKREASC